MAMPIHIGAGEGMVKPEINRSFEVSKESCEGAVIHPNTTMFEQSTYTSFREASRSFESKFAVLLDCCSHCPVNDGKWDGEPGDSKWQPDDEYIPKKSNPENQPWEDIKEEFGFDGIEFHDGEPDFSEVSKGEVEIDDFSDNRSDNFDKADAELAKQRGCTPEEVKAWRKEHGYTWHECKDMKTMQKVPSKVHNNIPHSGGISEAKKGEQHNEK